MKKSVRVSLIIIGVLLFLAALAVCVFFLLISPNINIMNAPNLDESKLASSSRTVNILDKNGDIIGDSLISKNRFYVTLSELNDDTVNAFIAIEDKRFYSHGGIDYRRACSALLSNIKSRSFREGASTISQQLIKNTHLSNEKTIKRKLVEMRLARQLEQKYTKEQILEGYFNILYFGSGIYGLGTACHVMYGISPSELSVAQSAALAAIINNPAKYNPYKNIDALNSRKNTILSCMLDQGYINKDTFEHAKNEKLEFSYYKQNGFTEAVIRSVCRERNISEKELFSGNPTFKTAYDAALANAAQKIIKSSNIDAKIRILALDNKTGGVACDESNGSENLFIKRSPASAIKPFIAYAPALESGYNPLSQIDDSPTDFNNYSPKNYKNVYRGMMSATDCLIYSSNVAAVKLVDEIGINNCMSVARKFGITFSEKDTGLPVALGGMYNGITLIDLANAYRTLANGGVYSKTRYVLDDEKDDKQYGLFEKSRAVGDDTAYLLTDMLMACAKSGTAKKLSGIPNIAAKTGTNGDGDGNTDCYCIAYTPNITIAVWLGAADKKIDNTVTGATCAKMIAQLISDAKIDTSKEFTRPDSVAYYDIDAQELITSHEVYLADPLLPPKYRKRVLLSKKHLPIRKSVDYLDFFDGLYLHDYDYFSFN